MARLSDRDIERLLQDDPAPAPPADLAARIKAEIPTELPRAAASEERRVTGFPLLPRRWLLAAATLVAAAGTALVTWHTLHPGQLSEVPLAQRQASAEPSAAPAAHDTPASAGVGSLPVHGKTAAAATGVRPTAPGRRKGAAAAPVLPALLGDAEVGTASAPTPPPAPAPSRAAGVFRESVVVTGQEEAHVRAKSEAGEPADAIGSLPPAAPASVASKVRTSSSRSAEVGSSLAAARAALDAGRLPAPASILPDDFLAAPRYGATPGTPLVIEGAPSPSVSGAYLVLVAARDRGPVALDVAFNAEAVPRHRIVAGSPGAATVLYEVELAGEPGPDVLLATVRVPSRAPGGARPGETRTLRAGDLAGSLEHAPAVELATLAGRLAEVLQGHPGDLAGLARRLERLVQAFPGDSGVVELTSIAAGAARLARPTPAP